jgi:histidinol dehydrogenase
MRVLSTRERTPQQIADDLAEDLLREAAEQEDAVRDIVAEVRRRGDEAVVEYTRRFDWPQATAAGMRVTEAEIDEGLQSVGGDFLRAVDLAAKRVRAFHERQIPTDWFDCRVPGTVLGQKFTPIRRVGIHVPGQSAALPSSLIMGVVPAQVAGVEELLLVTPPRRDGTVHPAILATAGRLGAPIIFKVGGAQAIAALAYGTDTIPKVDKIFGPGSPWVTLAKKLVYGDVGIEGLYGPSEVAIIADDSAEPRLIAADLLAQAEHMSDSPVFLVTPDEALIEAVEAELKRQLEALPRREIAQQSLDGFGALILAADVDQAVDVVNELAAEHVQVCTREPFGLLSKIRNAGAIFLGSSSPVPLGDYVIGPSHWLPTGRTARFSSGLGTLDFMKRSSIVYASREAVADHAEAVKLLAELEGLDGHVRAVQARLEEPESR